MKPVKSFLVISYETLMQLIFSLPRYKLLNYFKKLFLQMMGAKIGKNVVFYPGVWITPGRNLIIEEEVDLAKDVLIGSEGGVFIGKRTLIGYGSKIFSSNHSIPPIGEVFPVSGDVYKPVYISSDVWIGSSCIILPGVKIGKGCVVAAGSVVTKNIDDNSIVGGVPAKIIKMRNNIE